MTQDTTVTLRIPTDLKRRVQAVADQTQRSMSKAFILLLERGIEVFEQEGVLLDTRVNVRESLKRKTGTK